MKTAITAYQKKLRLSNNLIEIYESMPYETKEQFIHDLLETLYKERLENIIIRNLKNANFPVKKTLEFYDWSHVQLPDKLSTDVLIRLAFLEQQENLILYGNFGAGKTHLSIALGIKAINQNKTVYFFTVHALLFSCFYNE
ncbi:ATP-binding protein [Vallitaleaceae bacterium 9-2]